MRNIPSIKIIEQEGTNVHDLIKYKNVLFTTSSIKSFQERGVKDCSYKTLRWVGHHELINFLIHKCEVDDETLTHLLETSAEYEDFREDVVIIMVEVNNGDGLTWKKELIIKSTEKFTAMQQATAYPIASVASLLADGIFDGKKDERRDYYTYYTKNLSYQDVPFTKFNENLNKLFN